MTQNGYNDIIFYKYYNNIGTVLILIKTKENNIFGGFTPLNWGGNDNYPKDELNQTFLFFLDFNKYDLIKKNNYVIRCKKEEGLVFRNFDLKLGKDMRSVESYANGAVNYFTKNNLELSGIKGEYQSFEIQEIEIFKLIY